MDEENNLTQQLERRKRINRIKKGIITFLLVWMLIVTVLMVFLLVRVLALSRQVSILAANQIEISELPLLNSEATGADSLSSEMTETEDASEGGPTVELAALDEDNLAEPGDKLKVYLTFDDGPSGNTSRILDILDEYGVKASFFVVGREDEESQNSYKRIVDEGHTLGMHSYCHQMSALYDSLESFELDFTHIRDYLQEVTGQLPMYYRFPGSSSNQVSNSEMGKFISYLDEEGVVYFDWNVSSGDATNQSYTKEEIINNVLNDVVNYKTSVVLLHDSDIKIPTVEALPELIEGLKALGAEILPIDENTTPIQFAVLREKAEKAGEAPAEEEPEQQAAD